MPHNIPDLGDHDDKDGIDTDPSDQLPDRLPVVGHEAPTFTDVRHHRHSESGKTGAFVVDRHGDHTPVPLAHLHPFSETALPMDDAATSVAERRPASSSFAPRLPMPQSATHDPFRLDEFWPPEAEDGGEPNFAGPRDTFFDVHDASHRADLSRETSQYKEKSDLAIQQDRHRIPDRNILLTRLGIAAAAIAVFAGAYKIHLPSTRPIRAISTSMDHWGKERANDHAALSRVTAVTHADLIFTLPDTSVASDFDGQMRPAFVTTAPDDFSEVDATVLVVSSDNLDTVQAPVEKPIEKPKEIIVAQAEPVQTPIQIPIIAKVEPIPPPVVIPPRVTVATASLSPADMTTSKSLAMKLLNNKHVSDTAVGATASLDVHAESGTSHLSATILDAQTLITYSARPLDVREARWGARGKPQTSLPLTAADYSNPVDAVHHLTLISLPRGAFEKGSVSLATKPLAVEDHLMLCGNPSGALRLRLGGVVTGAADEHGRYPITGVGPNALYSMTGGPVLNENGELVGILVVTKVDEKMTLFVQSVSANDVEHLRTITQH